MSFLYPGFLFALFAVAIPIIIHLFNFRKFKKVYFSNVAFLKEIKEQNSSKEKLKNLLILLARILAIVFLVLAFARPYLPTKENTDINRNNVVSIYIDNSYSMDAVNKDGSLLDEAKRRAKDIVKYYRINDRFQLLTNDFEGKHQRLLTADEFLKALDEVSVSPAGRNLQQVLNRQQNIFNGSDNRFAYVISDFQKGFLGAEKLKSVANIQTTLVKLNANHLPNVAVDSLWFLSPTHQTKSNEQLVVRLTNFGDEDAKGIQLKLMINNQQKAISNLNVQAGKTKTDTLAFSGLNSGWQKGVVSIKDFPLTFDDQLNFSFTSNASQKVLNIKGSKAGSYIKALFGADRYFDLVEMQEMNINYSSFANYSLIILDELETTSSGLAQELGKFIKNGGSLVIFPNMDADGNTYSSFLTALQLPAVADLNKVPTKVASIELKHSVFKGVFESVPKQMDLPLVNSYFNYKESNISNKENLLQLPAGKLFLAKYAMQTGSVYLCASALNASSGNFAQHPIFVPLMYNIAFSSAKQQPLYYTISKDNVLESAKISLGKNQSLKLVSKDFEIIPEVKQNDGKTLLYIADQLKKSGFYDLKKGDSTIAINAFNDDRLESDMHYATKNDIENLISTNNISFLDTQHETITSAIAQKNNGNDLWKLCLILSLVFLALEIVLIKFYTLKINKIYEPSS